MLRENERCKGAQREKSVELQIAGSVVQHGTEREKRTLREIERKREGGEQKEKR